MDHLPSPPTSPEQQYYHDDDVDKAVCGSCDKTLSSDWFCINCHKRCLTCNRFLSADDHCSRCWTFDSQHNIFVRKQLPPPPDTTIGTSVPTSHATPISLSMTAAPPSPPPQPHHQRCHILFFVMSSSSPMGEKGMREKS